VGHGSQRTCTSPLLALKWGSNEALTTTWEGFHWGGTILIVPRSAPTSLLKPASGGVQHV
jgi:hypothetical protein